MGRYARNTAILAKIEATYGVDATPTEGANAILISNPDIVPLNAENVSRDLVRAFLGGSEQLVGASYVSMTFDVEIAGSGTAGVAPAYGPLLRACGFAESVTENVRTEYNLVTPVSDSLSIYYFSDGVKHVARGCRGDVSIKMTFKNKPVFSFKFLGLDGGMAAAVPAAQTTGTFQKPLAMSEANTGDLTFGAVYTAATPALTGGQGYPSQGIEISLGNSVSHEPLLGGESIDVTQRESSGNVTLDLTAAQEVSFMTTVKANTLQSIGLVHGTQAGNKFMVFLPGAQLIKPTKKNSNGRLYCGYEVRAIPVVGNDELKLVVF
ncbi:phage tail tube protein [Propionivibrio dicarboxylicus]|uniref:Uncharacterized protein n=1 Tax=Propionivibrio dicarboxylicus TaxID=83767 RepID=A0A1G8LEH7_9RHOO|nr:phage tail tube protein [Propionivibrio dicarboxylicus]SDI53877.1 hypothetical protein SAMN05660652_03611 [Propionivibrio dicarboxylicus]